LRKLLDFRKALENFQKKLSKNLRAFDLFDENVSKLFLRFAELTTWL